MSYYSLYKELLGITLLLPIIYYMYYFRSCLIQCININREFTLSNDRTMQQQLVVNTDKITILTTILKIFSFNIIDNQVEN